MSLFSCDDLYGISSLKKVLSYYDLRPEKGLGQNFLFKRSYLEEISEATGEAEAVVEIGPGMGALTCLLKEAHPRVIAVEIDDSLEAPFRDIVSSPAVTFLNEDFLGINPPDLDLHQDRRAELVGNIPYNLTSQIIEKGVGERSYFREMVLTLQREVAERILAEPGSREVGPITFLVRGYAEVERVVDVPREAFYPRPQVDSTTIRIVPGGGRNFEAAPGSFFCLVRELFNY
ncbi:ribosomal RNA small subunit methyltransferase A, partial [Candidatus Bipolaricaulota bacterium]|nr:ribosomal RNA small subunit methyltransferase A [Candidatus Bipolaricaulota bacterium]